MQYLVQKGGHSGSSTKEQCVVQLHSSSSSSSSAMLSVTPPVHSLSMLSVIGGRQKPPNPGPRDLLSNARADLCHGPGWGGGGGLKKSSPQDDALHFPNRHHPGVGGALCYFCLRQKPSSQGNATLEVGDHCHCGNWEAFGHSTVSHCNGQISTL